MAKTSGNLPMRAIIIGISCLFAVLVGIFLMLPAFFDVHVTDALFETPQEPWMLPDEVQKQYQFSVLEMKGKYQFSQYCESCHGPFGAGGGAQSARIGGVPNLLASATVLVNGATAEGFAKTIDQGVPGTAMPAFPHIAKHAKESIVAYLEYLIRNREKMAAMASQK
jgi:mono/diheme cytochrome c family protein